jgi:MSHA pilin protein MshD
MYTKRKTENCIDVGSQKTRRKMRGVTLIELILFMLIVSIAVVAILRVMGMTSLTGTDPMREKQALAIAESLLEEIELQAFTYCDPDDANATTAISATNCASLAQGLGPNPGETRTGNLKFDNVGDYHNLAPPSPPVIATKPDAIVDIQGQIIAGLEDYKVEVTETAGVGGDQIQIDVTVTSGAGSDAVNVKLTGYRYRYAPRTVP